MGKMVIEQRYEEWTPVAVGGGETVGVFAVEKGERVIWASAELLQATAAGTTPTITLGDGVDPDGYIAAADIDLETAALGTLKNGAGALLAASGGKLYEADDTVDVVYTPGATPGAVKPIVAFRIGVVREDL